MKTAIYARISSAEEGDTLGVERQIEDCQAEAKRRGWEVVETFIDNNVSATRTKARPQYQRLLKAVTEGKVQAVVVWDVDRLTRSPRELEDVIDLADKLGLSLASVGGEIDLGTPQGRMTARIKGTVARHEVEQSSRRIKRKLEQKALDGMPHSMPGYGFRRVTEFDDLGRRIGAHDEIIPEQAEVIVELAERFLAGETTGSLVRDFNERGIPGPRGNKWELWNIKRLLIRPAIAGLRDHNGVIVGKTQAGEIITPEQHERLVALLTDPARRTNHRGPGFRHLLSGIATCGKCGGLMKRITRGQRTHLEHLAAYSCKECNGIRRLQAPLDEYVSALVIERLSRPDAVLALTSGDEEAVKTARAELDLVNAKLATAADQFAEDIITADQLRRVTEKLRIRVAECEAKISAEMPGPSIETLAGPDAAERWNNAAMDVKRQVVSQLMNIRVMPSDRRRGFNPDFIEITWK